MDAFLIEKFEEEGGERIKGYDALNTEDAWGAEFPGIDEAVRAIASVAMTVAEEHSHYEGSEGGSDEDRNEHLALAEVAKYLASRLSLQSYGLGWVVS